MKTVPVVVERQLPNFMNSGVSFYYLTDGSVVVWDERTGEVSTLHDEDVRQVA